MELGSIDTNSSGDDDDEYDEDDDGFIVEDDDELSEQSNNEEEEEETVDDDSDGEEVIVRRPKRRSSVFFQPISSDDSSDVITDATNDDSNEVVSASVQQVESIVVINSNRPDAEHIVEGKTFATTFIVPDNELPTTESANSNLSKSTIVTVPSPKTSAEEKKLEIVEEKSEQESSSVLAQEDESVQEQAVATEAIVEVKATDAAAEPKQSEPETETEQADGDKALQTVKSPPPVLDGKENQSLAKKMAIKHRSSLPGIVSLPKASKNKKPSRVSLGDLDRNAQNVDVNEMVKQTQKAPSTKKTEAKATSILEEQADNMLSFNDAVDDSDSGSVSQSDSEDSGSFELRDVSDTDEESDSDYIPILNISSQEENNNQKVSTKKGTFSPANSDFYFLHCDH